MKWDSVPKKKVGRCSLGGTVVGQTDKWALNGCSSSNELGARYVQPHQKPRRPYLQEEDMPDASKYVNNHRNAIWCCLFEKSFGCSVSLAWAKVNVPRYRRDSRVGRTKRLMNGKANCFTILRQITKLKCVNSDVKSVHLRLKKGSLKWVHGTMPEPPWKSH